MTDLSSVTTPEPTVVQRILVVVGLIAYLATGFIYLTSGLVVPFPWLIVLWLVWLAGMWITARLMARWSWWVLSAAPAAMAFWWAYLSVGEAVFGWTP
jgi:xanthosine utilization system XapX-like protein